MRRSANTQSIGRSVGPVGARSWTITMEPPEGMRERIVRRAYGLWRERGCRDGYALQDWLDAEAMVTGEFHEARE
jgi:hypothetical protein